MAVERPTFSESWYRVADLKPRLRTVIQTYRQHYRGRMWHVLRDPSNNQFFRLDEAGYQFVGMLNGQRTVTEVWQTCNEQLGDRAPTQGEAIQLMGQLFTSNLLQCELPADAHGMFDRYDKRVKREVTGYLMNLLFMRIPIFDPERILQTWCHVFGWVFNRIGFILWAVLVAIGFTHISGHLGELVDAANPQLLLKTENLLLLYTCFAGIKAIHEFGHGFACKRYGLQNGSGGEVHTIGIMLLVMMPVPYVDATSAWAFRSKWQRAMVGFAGIYVELAVASVAAIIWANTAAGTLIHDICFNVMFIASVSTLLFNGNPLLRYDGYYILSDLIEIPNLSQRSKDYLYYLVKKYIYRAQRPRNPAHSSGEKAWMFVYSITAGIYRVFISVAIMLYLFEVLQGVLFFLALFFAASGIIGFAFKPMWAWAKYLFTSGELARTRTWAVTITAIFFGGVITLIGFIQFPDHMRLEGVSEPADLAQVHTQTDGFIVSVTETGTQVDPDGAPLLVLENPKLHTDLEALQADHKELAALIRQARANNELGVVLSRVKQQQAVQKQIERVQQDIDALTIHSPIKGIWTSPNIEFALGRFLSRGELIGHVATKDMIIRAIADQTLGPRIRGEFMQPKETLGEEARAEVRVKGRPSDHFEGIVRWIAPAGTSDLPSAALGYIVGGSIQVDATDQEGRTASENVFEVRIDPRQEESHQKNMAAWQEVADVAKRTGKDAPPQPQLVELRSGQRVAVRMSLPQKPLAAQWWRMLRQMLQQRFQM